MEYRIRILVRHRIGEMDETAIMGIYQFAVNLRQFKSELAIYVQWMDGFTRIDKNIGVFQPAVFFDCSDR